MSKTPNAKHKQDPTNRRDILDVAIIGAGISGINTAYRIQTELPDVNYAIFEARDTIGGTWDFFKYPGLRSDSDLFTFGFSWRPWTKNNPIADAGSILEYLRAATTVKGIDNHIQFNTRIQKANWLVKSHLWELTATTNNGVEHKSFARFLVLGTGYYDYEQALPVIIPGLDSFEGQTVHPQYWPTDLDYTDKRVVCIGSGATAITLIPVLAQKAASVTMLQRSPSYIVSISNSSKVSSLKQYLPERLAYILNRLYFLTFPILFYYFCRLFPTLSKNAIRKAATKQLPEGYPVDPNFTPRYNPFDQRVCFAPDGDFYDAVRRGAKIVTGTIKQVVSDGILLDDGSKLYADIIITATGLKMLWGGKISITVDGNPYRIGDKLAWHSAMLQDLPNAMVVTGYVMASWTLGADATAFLLCRLLRGMRRHGLSTIIPRVPTDGSVKACPLIPLSSTYVLAAAADSLPKSGNKGPWKRRFNYFTDTLKFKYGDVTEDLETYQEDLPVTGLKF
ncbi:uncharacterized protein Z519_05927 [Cladophialophora bantiana CBS 173.52]|uniref:FAD/NAD(P)-binding domain-containing protein n=1 Tax=Cladophialophora bantiana (strain ATCC 10958 / CBS 173.52 / CDC B-1940 / NIH 8579) TaxID=1442370 RepID=A0A0D2G3S2_CLAB1|nr:uncharacterized protein Z519_05927 [Cladophialophora bantiana CBS 173.52]KIW93322.1 hypothetical protein Z519_05927 [Cladophialophora bantiana CBS 173.52]